MNVCDEQITEMLIEKTEAIIEAVNGICDAHDDIDRQEAERLLLCTLLLQVCKMNK